MHILTVCSAVTLALYNQVKSKVYDYRAMYQSAVSGQLATQLANMPPFGAIHDIRGTRNMIATYVSTPSLLEPQGSANPGR